MNDIVSVIESDKLIFIDDTSLLATGPDPAMTAAQLNRDLVKISNWATFNGSKLFLTNNNSPPIILNDIAIEKVNCHRHLLDCKSCLG